MKYSYRIVEDGNGDMIAQKQTGDGSTDPYRWVFFLDLSDCVDLQAAEHLLKRTILSQEKKIVGYYDTSGERID